MMSDEIVKLTLQRVEQIDEKLDKLVDSFAEQRERLAKVEVKSGFFGTIGGFIGGFVAHYFRG